MKSNVRVCAALNFGSDPKNKQLEVEGHMPQCPIACDSNAHITGTRSAFEVI